jgi:DNA polymerase III epsilon subunit family exonuclease
MKAFLIVLLRGAAWLWLVFLGFTFVFGVVDSKNAIGSIELISLFIVLVFAVPGVLILKFLKKPNKNIDETSQPEAIQGSNFIQSKMAYIKNLQQQKEIDKAEAIRLKQELKEKEIAKLEADKIEAKRIEDEVKKDKLRAKYQPFVNLQNSIDLIPIKLVDDPIYKTRNNDPIPEIKTSAVRPSDSRDKFGNFIVVDVETTGLSARRDEIIEIAAVKFLEFEPVECMTTFIKPKNAITEEITDINGITNDHVKDAPSIHQVVDSFKEFFGTMPVVAHNLSFDYKFLHTNNIDLTESKRKYFDTLEISQKMLKKYDDYKADRAYDRDADYEYDVMDHKLDTLCDFFEIHRPTSHRAMSDCIATGLIFRNMVYTKLDQ